MDFRKIFSREKAGAKKDGAESRIPLILFNTQTKTKEVFSPINHRVVKMYNCGPTVYDSQHIGNLRSYVFADILKRVLLYNGYPIKQVVNITDVGHLTSDEDSGEDKMEKGSKEKGIDTKELSRKITKEFKNDLEKLNIKTESIIFTQATDYIREQIALASSLDERGYTYKTKDGIYFDTSRFPNYGSLGNIDIEKLKEGARVEINPEKRNPSDFAIWKFSPEGEQRQQEWDSPWGKGFPGWHLECTAMIFAELGKQIDIHTGGIDHIPIHHNNEIAQAESITKKQYVRYWLHNAFITIEGQKISKSIGNTVLLRQLEDRKFSPLSYRYWLLTGHYQSPLNFTWEALEGAEKAFSRLLRIFIDDLGNKNGNIDKAYKERFHKHINDNLDTPGALAILWKLVRDDSVSNEDKRITLLDFDKVLGLGLIEGHRKLSSMLKGIEKKLSVSETPQEIRVLLSLREKAREEREWEKADEIRKEIELRGYSVLDTPDGAEIQEDNK